MVDLVLEKWYPAFSNKEALGNEPMATVTTARILANKALQKPCDQDCVDWATSMLEQGRDGRYLAILAGMVPPLNHFELADLRDPSLRELCISELSNSVAICIFAAECLRLHHSPASRRGSPRIIVGRLNVILFFLLTKTGRKKRIVNAEFAIGTSGERSVRTSHDGLLFGRHTTRFTEPPRSVWRQPFVSTQVIDNPLRIDHNAA